MLNNNYKKINQTLLFAMCDNMREGTAILEVESNEFVYYNKSFLKLFDVAFNKTINLDIFRKFRKEILTPSAINERKKVVEEKGGFNELVEFISAKGQPFFGEVSIQFFKNDTQSYYFIIINPIEKAFFELASLGILMVNKNGEIASVNPYIVKQFGYTKSELIGKKIEILIPSRFHEQHVVNRNEFVQHPKDRQIGFGKELYACRKDGTEFPVEISLGHYPSDGDKYVIAFINDITLRREAQNKLKDLNNELEIIIKKRTADLNETLERLKLSESEMQKVFAFQKILLDKAGAMIVSVDSKGIVQTFNPEAEIKTGYKASEIIGKHTPLFLIDTESLNEKAYKVKDDWKYDFNNETELFENPELLEKLIKDAEWLCAKKDGSTFPVQLNVTVLKDEDGITNGYIGVAVDITRLKKFENDLQLALEREKELSELKSRFVSMASHEFRTPLSTVLSSSYLIEKYTAAADQPKRVTHLQRIVSSVTMLTDILNDFLSVGKIEEGKIQIKPIQLNLIELVHTVIGEMKSSLRKKQKIKYTHNGDHNIKLDPSLLKHILMNLISNASKFSAEGSSIEINSSCSIDHLALTIKDYGIGIASDDQQHLTERFFRGANAVNIQGTGLGLHIVAKYIQLMNGAIECKSDLNKGTEFIITFKLQNQAI